jgi:hypothetical protein
MYLLCVTVIFFGPGRFPATRIFFVPARIVLTSSRFVLPEEVSCVCGDRR